MGRRTWESLPTRFRPLPGRRNVVLSCTLDPAEAGVPVARSVAEVLALDGDVWVIGGGEVYRAFLPHAAELVVTEVDTELPGDTWAPALDPSWTLGVRVPGEGWIASAGGLRFRVSHWSRAAAGDGLVPRTLAEQSDSWDGAARPGGAVGAGR
jgi:dihydrofolate reductase